jgi:hypothetical protein
MDASLHCSIIGTCLTTAELRKVMGRMTSLDATRASDHDLHAQAVGLCSQNNALSKLLQKALDQNHRAVIKRFSKLSGETAVIGQWRDSLGAGDIPGAYWAVLTHPDVGPTGMRRAFGDVHMLSHLVGAANRADISRLAAIEAENAVLRDKVERQQARLAAAIQSRDQTIQKMSRLAAAHIAETTTGAAAGEEPDALRALVVDLQQRLSAEAARRERLEARAGETARLIHELQHRTRQAEQGHDALQRDVAALERHIDTQGAPEPGLAIAATRTLYVGGRPHCVDQMRNALGAVNAELLHHDGGQHDNMALLAGLIGQADHVVFPVDCVSHEAALMVKRICRQSGKSWQPLRSSGLSSFLVCMAQHARSKKALEGTTAP